MNLHLWDELVQNIAVNATLDVLPKVTPQNQQEKEQENERTNKRKLAAKNGPAIVTPISPARKRKEPKRADSNNEPNMRGKAQEKKDEKKEQACPV